ncbi:tetraacyldisaccharide 4'-kinase [Flavobacterium sp.]|jgi:tetraacyldisaccharide 4'-kinase|uniref:tetraacyldisaccharide 4'-kinase n=1 Tax=Flavobacterium sp. TaxID=239 RepID=UPI002A7F4F3C|nr:tetraacyldisaccharide 4'-kinase [Flavobacterium sp.]
MNFLRKILFPVAFVYWIVTWVRNYFYDKQVFKSKSFDLPIIAVGNLSVGGTGKTPQIEYLIRLLHDKFKVATLSRGYKRETNDFILADDSTTVKQLGDEPFQFFTKFPKVKVAVDADRINGITQLLKLDDAPDVILLDDAFQHRKVKAGFYILLTTYSELFYDDYILPFGNLREPSSGKKRANMIIVTKCPVDISELAMSEIKKNLDVDVPVFFSKIEYDEFACSEIESINAMDLMQTEKTIITGIAKPFPFIRHLKKENDLVLEFSDHHNFTEKEIDNIKELANNKTIVTTEKDFMRLQGSLPKEQLFYLPIKSSILNDADVLDKIILDYVGENRRNSSVHSKDS